MSKISTNRLVLKLFISYWRRFPRLFFMSLLIGPLAALQNVVTPLFIALGLGQLSRHHHVDMQLVLYASLSLVVALIAGYYVNIRSDALLEHKIDEAIYNDNFRYLMHQDYDFYANNFSGSLVTRANRLVKAHSIFHMTVFIEMLPQLFTVLFALIVMATYNFLLASAVALLWVVAVCIISLLAIKRVPLRRAAVDQESLLTGELADAVTNAVTVKTFAAEAVEIARYEKTNHLRGDYFLRSWNRAIQNSWVIEAICGFLQIAVFAFGIIAVQRSSLSLAAFLLFQVYILRIVDSLRRTSLIVRQFEGVLGDAQEMTELLTQPPLVADPPTPAPLKTTRGAINFTNVSFSYSADQTKSSNLFQDFNLAIASGERIGLVGPSGGGKTTITKLLLRFSDVQAGSITIDDQDIRSVAQADLHRAISYVPQEPLLFHRTIAENIRYGKPAATLKDVKRAARLAHATEFIDQLQHGYDTIVGERGIKLSGGQRQRIAIARAILKEAPILVLDEATSALDSESEKAIQSALWELMKDRTAIVIAHRLSTIQRLDRIVVLDDGAITESGSHAELLKTNGTYARLWKHQSGGFIEE